jgi:CRISPR-associated protein Cas5d
MSYGVKLKVWGDYACFTRPEMKVERVSYDVMTPSAARGILEAIYWKPAIMWVIDRIHVLKPIRFTYERRNQVASKLPLGSITKAMIDGKSPISLFIEEDRQQRAAMVLKDVAYVIEAHFTYTSDEDNNDGKHLDMFNRRVGDGQCFMQPYLGCREFPAHYELIKGEIPASPLTGEKDLGWMLHDIDFKKGMQAKFFHPTMKNGVVDVPPFDGEEVKA